MKYNTTSKYPSAVIFMHWMMFLLVIMTYAFIEFRELFPKGTDPRNLMKLIHFSLGFTVFLSVLLRIYFRLSSNIIVEHLSIMAKLGHLFLYLFLLTMPILGWLTLSAEGKDIPFFVVSLPSLIAENKELAHTLEDWHETLGIIGYWAIGGHALMALYHHYVKREPIFNRILP